MEHKYLKKVYSIDLSTCIYLDKLNYKYRIYFHNNISKFYCFLCKTSSLRRTYCKCQGKDWHKNFWNGIIYDDIDLSNGNKIYDLVNENLEKIFKLDKNELLNWLNLIKNNQNENIILIIIENIMQSSAKLN